MEKIKDQLFQEERALFMSRNKEIESCQFENGESPLKESMQIVLKNCSFQWKYPLWYCRKISADHTYFKESARSGIWYTQDITITDSTIDAPKTFRRSSYIHLKNVTLPHATETLWTCEDVRLENVEVTGDYFGMNSSNIFAQELKINGNYCFDGGSNIEIHNAVLNSKDAFWNCENVLVFDSTIIGEYLGWNSKNVTFINCTIESLQGMCYMKNVRLENCRLIRTTLAFEYSSVHADINGTIDSVFNPLSGEITADEILQLTLDETKITPSRTQITEVKKVAV